MIWIVQQYTMPRKELPLCFFTCKTTIYLCISLCVGSKWFLNELDINQGWLPSTFCLPRFHASRATRNAARSDWTLARLRATTDNKFRSTSVCSFYTAATSYHHDHCSCRSYQPGGNFSIPSLTVAISPSSSSSIALYTLREFSA